MKAYLNAHKSTLKGAFAVDSGDTEFLGAQLKSLGMTIPAGGFDTTGATMPAIQSGTLEFTIYQDPYLQGFLPVLYLYLYNLSGGVLAPPDTDTGLSVVTKSNVGPYVAAQPVPGQHDRGEVHPAARRRDQRPDGLDKHLIGRTSVRPGRIRPFRPGPSMRACRSEKARQARERR